VIYIVATLTAKPEKRAELIAGAQACVAETRKEAGNIAYDMHESVTEPTKMVFVEQWENIELRTRAMYPDLTKTLRHGYILLQTRKCHETPETSPPAYFGPI
jgi:Antibiotic biosynthesis monooxygenase